MLSLVALQWFVNRENASLTVTRLFLGLNAHSAVP